MRRSQRISDNIITRLQGDTKAVDEDGNDADKNLPTEAALKCERPYTLDEAEERLETMMGEYIKTGGFLKDDQWADFREYFAFVRKRAASKRKINGGECHHVVPEFCTKGKRSKDGFVVLVTKSEHIHMHKLLASFMPYNRIAKAVYAMMSGASNGYRLMGAQGGRAAKGVPKGGRGAKGVPNTGGAAKGVAKTGGAAKGVAKTGGAAKGGVKSSKYAFRFNATCKFCGKRVFSSSTNHRCLNSRSVRNSKNRLVLDEIDL